MIELVTRVPGELRSLLEIHRTYTEIAELRATLITNKVSMDRMCSYGN